MKREKNVKAIIPVHFAGQPCRMDEFGKIAKEFNLNIVEDGCHALGGSYIKNNKSVKVGSCADSHLTTFSFHPIKNITTGEGGAITTKEIGDVTTLSPDPIPKASIDKCKAAVPFAQPPI